MTARENLWSLGLLGVLLLAFLIFRRLRRRTQSYSEVKSFKGRLLQWVRIVEKSIWIAIALLISAAAFWGFQVAHGIVKPGHPIEGATAVFSIMGVWLIALPLAMLAANGVSWLLPPIRAANLSAMDGLNVSFSEFNRGLILFGCVSVPVGILEIIIAVLEPWAR